jgi:hypothetical protein
MQAAVFNAKCPVEIGDKIKFQGLAEVHTITDIACTNYLKSGTVEFLYELDSNGRYLKLDIPVPRATSVTGMYM